MALSVADFLVAFPEFRDALSTEGLIEAKITQAAARVSARQWGANTAVGQALFAAHLLALSPYGRDARLSQASRETIYGDEFKILQRATVGGPRVTGGTCATYSGYSFVRPYFG